MEGDVKYLDLSPLPYIKPALLSGCIPALNASQNSLKSITKEKLGAILEWSDTRPINSGKYFIDISPIMHRGSRTLSINFDQKLRSRYSSREFFEIKNLKDRFYRESLSSSEKFLHLLKYLHSLQIKTGSDFREVDGSTGELSGGFRIRYPHPWQLEEALENLRQTLISNTKICPLSAAILAYAGLLATHPFTDGNGRTARLLFNLILIQEISIFSFIPIHELNIYSKSSIFTYLRESLFTSDLRPIIFCFMSSISCTISIDMQFNTTEQ